MAALAMAALMPLAAHCQVDQESGSAKVEAPAPSYKYEAWIGYGYTSLNQVAQSRYGLQGVEAGVTRDWGKYFGLTGEADYYKKPLNTGNPGDPSVYSILGGPEVHFLVWESLTAFGHGLLGFEHTGGEHMNPASSLAGGGGGGVEWAFKLAGRQLALRAEGDDISASFSLQNPLPGWSSHRSRNSRASFGVAYRF